MKLLINRIFISIELILIFSLCIFAEDTKLEIIHSDSAELLFKEGKVDIIKLIDNVNLKYFNQNLKGHIIIFDKSDNKIYSDEEVEIIGEEYTLDSKKLSINLINNNFFLKDNTGFFPPWYIKSKEIFMEKEDEYILVNGYLTSCEHSKPHYRFKFSKIKYYKNDKLKAYNMIFYLGKVPIFYIPYFSKSLKYSPWAYSGGYSKERGVFLKNVYDVYNKKNIYAGLLIDIYAKAGIGKGIRYDQKTDTVIANISVYHINEKLDNQENERYKFEGNYSRKFREDFYFTSVFSYFSDLEINQKYASDFNHLQNFYDIKSYIAKRRDNDLFLIYYTRRADRNEMLNKFTLTEETKPGLYYMRNYSKYKNLLFNYQFNYNNEYILNKREYNSNFNFTNNYWYGIPISNKSKFSAMVSYYCDYDSIKKNDDFKNFTDKLGLNLYQKYRFDLNRYIIFHYDYLKKLNNIEHSDTDYCGVENNSIKIDYYQNINNKLNFKIGSGYDFNSYAGEDYRFQDKILNLYNKIEYSNNKIKLFNELIYNFSESKLNRNFFNISYDDKNLFEYNGSLFYYRYSEEKYGISNDIKFQLGKYISDKYKNDYIIFYQDRLNLKDMEFKEIFTGIEKRLHCFTMKLQFRKYDNDEQEYFLLFSINDIPSKNIKFIYNPYNKDIKFAPGF